AAILNLCIENDEEFEKLDMDKISQLTIYAIEIRYPEEHIEISIDEVKELYIIVRTVKEFVIKRLKEKGMEI
ncbi:MAG: hypothetical protein Q8N79_06120, partial [Candidatus Methanoperedens sp.]|nr:hypothetical protein [Candidatus Methanoperedens sp.]